MDERGYVLSGLGMLLIIPVIIMIPVALSVMNASSDLPNTFVKSDTAFYANKNIQRDMSIKLANFADDIDNSNNTNIYSWNNTPINNEQNANLLANNISSLYSTTNSSFYLANNSLGVDNLSVTAFYTGQSMQNNNNISGVIPLKNGIMIAYNFTSVNNTTFGKNNNQYTEFYYNYTFYPIINSTISTTKANDGQIVNYVDTNDSSTVEIDVGNDPTQTTINNHINSFFGNLKSLLLPYCQGS